MARYKQLLFYAAKLPAMPAEQHLPENKVEGCVSQVRPVTATVLIILIPVDAVTW
jgi:sulfur transfer protein SufE